MPVQFVLAAGTPVNDTRRHQQIEKAVGRCLTDFNVNTYLKPYLRS